MPTGTRSTLAQKEKKKDLEALTKRVREWNGVQKKVGLNSSSMSRGLTKTCFRAEGSREPTYHCPVETARWMVNSYLMLIEKIRKSRHEHISRSTWAPADMS